MRRLNVLFIARARHTSLVFPGNSIADTRVTSGREAATLSRVYFMICCFHMLFYVIPIGL